jgi:hypothetical protein
VEISRALGHKTSSAGSRSVTIGGRRVVAYAVQVSTPSARCFQDDRFVHEAVFYEGEDDFAAQTVPFILDGVAAGEPTLVAVGEGRNLRLRAELGLHADQVQFFDMEALGRNPARIISAWHDFVAAHADGTVVRVHVNRSPL